MGKNHIKIREEEGQKYIVLSEAFGSRDKILNFIYFVFISSLLFVFLYFIFPEISSISGGIVAFLGFGFYFLMAYRFINKALKTEYLIVDGNELTVFKGGFLNKSQRTFDIDEITFFRHLDKPIREKHPLAGESFDYLGFETISKLANELYGDDRLAFEYEGETVTFGENIYSWDFEKIESEVF